MRTPRSLLTVVAVVVMTVIATAAPSVAGEASGIKGVWVRGGSTEWRTASDAFGPLHSARIFYPAELPASYAGSRGSDLPDDVTLVVSYRTRTTNVAAYVCSMPARRNVILSYHHEPEQKYPEKSPFATGADYVAAFTGQSAKIRQAASDCGRGGQVKVAMIALSWSYANSTRRGYTCSFIPPAGSVDYYLADTYDPYQLSLAREPGFQRWKACTAGGKPRGLAEHGIGQGNGTFPNCQFTDAQRARVLHADDAYLGANFPGFALWEYSWTGDAAGDACWHRWRFPIGGQSAAQWEAIATGAPLPPVT
jgi:hypothetical protein